MNAIELRHGAWSARIAVSSGANCISLCHSGYGMHILREPPEAGERDNPYLYGMPLLFPVNRISGGKFVFEGREYRFPINEPQTGCHLHGDLHDAPFAVTEVGEGRLCCSLTRGARAGFPHAFRLDVTYTLAEAGLVQEVRVYNLSDRNMPCLLGFHTTFDLSREADVCAHADVGVLIERDENYLPTGRFPAEDEITRALNASDFRTKEIFASRHYRAAGQGEMGLYFPKRGLRLRYETDEKFGFRLIYNGGSDAYICLEPQSCAVDAANASYPAPLARIPFVPPHDSLCFTSKITLEKENRNEDH